MHKNDTVEAVKPMAGKKKKRVGKLDNFGGVLTEMARVYREMRNEEIESLDGSRLVSALTQIRGTLELSELELRLRALEDRKNV